MNKKKNQHYVPQFYLKNFSNNGEGKTVNLFNPKKGLFVKGAPIKNQSSKNYFYGRDGKVEEGLSQIENVLAPRIAEFTHSNLLPKKFSEEYFSILILNDLRNPIHIEQIKSFLKLANQHINEFSQGKQKNLIPEITHDYAVELSLFNYEIILKICLDLNYKLLLNVTDNPFITCDFPTIKYNQFLEKKSVYDSITGYSTIGIQILLPINANKCLLFYDSDIYKVGNNRDTSIKLTINDVDQINVLQMLNCKENTYFNERIKESYIRKIFEKSKKYKKANIPKASSHGVIKNNEIKENEQIIHFRTTDLLINMHLSQIKLTRRANFTNLMKGMSPIREKAKLIIDKTNVNNELS